MFGGWLRKNESASIERGIPNEPDMEDVNEPVNNVAYSQSESAKRVPNEEIHLFYLLRLGV
jgi:hypothetical protein